MVNCQNLVRHCCKVVTCLENEKIARNLNFESVNPRCQEQHLACKSVYPAFTKSRGNIREKSCQGKTVYCLLHILGYTSVLCVIFSILLNMM